MKKFSKGGSAAAVCAAAVLFLSSAVMSHCEIPCGIYDDAMRIRMMAEDIATIEKSMREIHELAATHISNSDVPSCAGKYLASVFLSNLFSAATRQIPVYEDPIGVLGGSTHNINAVPFRQRISPI